jgi:cell division protein FtsB
MLKKILSSKFTTPIFLIMLFFLSLTIAKIWPPVDSIRKELAALKQKINEADKVIVELDKSKELMQSEDYLEQQARLKLNYKMPYEKVIYVYKNPNQEENKSGQELKTSQKQSANIWQKIWTWVLGQ